MRPVNSFAKTFFLYYYSFYFIVAKHLTYIWRALVRIVHSMANLLSRGAKRMLCANNNVSCRHTSALIGMLRLMCSTDRKDKKIYLKCYSFHKLLVCSVQRKIEQEREEQKGTVRWVFQCQLHTQYFKNLNFKWFVCSFICFQFWHRGRFSGFVIVKANEKPEKNRTYLTQYYIWPRLMSTA